MIETLIDKIDDACTKFKQVRKSKIKKFTKLDDWLNKEATIFINETQPLKKNFPNFKRGEIIKVDFGVNIGTELSHTHFAIVLNNDDTNSNDNITVLPISSKNGYKRIALGKILKEAIPNTKKYNLYCYGMITQIKTISKKRIFKEKIKYICNSEILDKIDKCIINYLTNSKPINISV